MLVVEFGALWYLLYKCARIRRTMVKSGPRPKPVSLPETNPIWRPLWDDESAPH